MAVDSQAQASILPIRTMTQPTAPADSRDRDRARKVIDTNNLDEQDLKNLKKYDPFLYYSIPSVVRDAKAKAVRISNDDDNEESQVQGQIPLQDGNGSQSSIDSDSAAPATTTSTAVERKTRISYECHPDLILESLLEHEDKDCVVDVDPILQLMHIMHVRNEEAMA